MLRLIATLVLILAGCAFGAVLLCLLALRVVFSIACAVSGVRRQARAERALEW